MTKALWKTLSVFWIGDLNSTMHLSDVTLNCVYLKGLGHAVLGNFSTYQMVIE